ncbi:MAG: hypothetical protein ACI9A7_000359 [Cyclobacteriaceae bacterium]|jgi:hypothetical protein
MDEYFLHFLWKFQKFNRRPLLIASGQQLSIFNTGYSHDHAGPDFEEAKIKIGDITWNGPVEIHYRSSDWFAHGHASDKRYDSVILHVVWIDDKPIEYADSETVPTLILKDFVDQNLTEYYRQYINQTDEILCGGYDLNPLFWLQMKDHAIAQRLELKSNEVNKLSKSLGSDWEETAYHLLCRNMGFSVNKEAFIKLSEILPHKVLKKHTNSAFQIEALIFGQSGFLDNPQDDYQKKLNLEFEFLKTKYQLTPAMHRTQWMFLRLRPANFPTIRLSQLAAFIAQNHNLFSWLTQLEKVDIRLLPLVQPSTYWDKHYDFGKQLKNGTNSFGLSSWQNIIINTSIPLLSAYSHHIKDQALLDKAVAFLSFIKPEDNRITRKWSEINLKIENALDSQALIHQYRTYCLKKKCLQCNIGVNILQRC